MTSAEFLRAVWPSKGVYIIALGPFVSKEGKKYFKHRAFDTIEDALKFVAGVRFTDNVFFALHSFDEACRDDETGKVRRRGEFARWVRSCYADWDIGNEPGKYASQEDAVAAALALSRMLGWPDPLIVNSGGGIHTYWIFARDMPTSEWRRYGDALKDVCRARGFAVDFQCVADISRVLRVVGTMNHKPDYPEPRLVKTWTPWAGDLLTADDLANLIKVHGELPRPEVSLQQQEDASRSEADKPTFAELGAACKAYRRLCKTSDRHGEPHWYAMLQLTDGVQDGNRIAHELSARHPDYDPVATDAKMARPRELGIGLPTCEHIQSKIYPEADSPCNGCWFAGRVGGSPIRAALSLPLPQTETMVVDPPTGYSRTKDGITYTPPPPGIPVTIIPYDMHPVRIVEHHTGQERSVVWEVVLPRTGPRQIELPISIYNDPKMLSILANNGIIVFPKHQKQAQAFMSSYIKELQRAQDEHRQYPTFGWTPKHDEFVIGHTAYSRVGSKRIILAPSAADLADAMTPHGTLQAQIQALNFYDHDDYLPQQLMISMAYGALFFHLTKHPGMIVNLTGETGVSKTTSLLATNGVYASPDTVVNGSRQGSTYKGLMQRMTVHNAIPLCIDEVTNMPAEQMQELALDVSQSGPRINALRQPNQNRGAARRSLLLCMTSNRSILDTIATHNQVGTAGSMRTLEMSAHASRARTKREADTFIASQFENYGHIGPVYVSEVLRRMSELSTELDTVRAAIEAETAAVNAERFWTDGGATAILGCRTGRRLGLLPFDPDKLMRFVCTKVLPSLRVTVSDHSTDPLHMLINYIERSHPGILRVTRDKSSKSETWYLQDKIMGTRGILGRYEIENGQLYLAIEPFKLFCREYDVNYNRVAAVLAAHGYAERMRYVLGKGLAEVATGQSWVLRVDMTNPRIGGQVQQPAPAAQEKVVPLRANR